MRLTSIQLRRADPDAVFDWKAWLASDWLHHARLLKQDGDSRVYSVPSPLQAVSRPDGDGLIIKIRSAAARSEPLKRLLRSTRGDRQWRGARWLAAHAFPTARPLILASALADSAPVELLVMQQLRGCSLLHHLAAFHNSPQAPVSPPPGFVPIPRQHTLAAAAGVLVARLSQARRYNRDGKPSNLIVTDLDDSHADIATIDSVAIRPDALRASNEFQRMLARLFIEPLGCAVPPRRALAARALYAALAQLDPAAPTPSPSLLPPASPPPHARRIDPDRRRRLRPQFKRLWSDVRTIIEAHKAPTPSVSPLEPAPHPPSHH